MNADSRALLLLVVGNLAAALSDVAVKCLDGGVPPFQYLFIRQLVATLLVLPLWLTLPAVKRSPGPIRLALVRAHLILVGAAGMVVALSHLPLATANAVFYAAPLLMLPLSVWLLGERPGRARVLATLAGFAGVMLVLRPSQFHWAALFALGTALTLALFNLLVRRLPPGQSPLATVFWTNLLCLPVAALLAAVNWVALDAVQLQWIVASALGMLTYNALAVVAYRLAQASAIALAEYSGLLFVALFGVMWFAEVPDSLSLLGIALIVLPIGLISIDGRRWRRQGGRAV
ncbi:DMT family transporter [Ferrimonas sediminicola]|uniref:DMT family transporter n=1 Tax=Ferrimonas sediminicola TaxID=2569538 RepID=A0A4U1BHE2_9GAMM|nr:DMT family transporter [Ferrimonas sediminicola]TKB50661.1 DMT family transporter [Ferrimonas sediminicola]